MTWTQLQELVAKAALWFLPLTVVNFGVALTLGDVFLIAAILMNFREMLVVRRFQIPFFGVFILMMLSALSDTDITLVRLLQTLYIWGLVLPFGWCAFTNLRMQTIARVLSPEGEVRYILHRVEDVTELVQASEVGE